MRRLRSARLAVLACLSLRPSSGTILRPHSSFFQMRKMASSGIRYEYVDGQTRSGLHKRAGRMLSDSTGQALAATWVEVARASAEADELPGVMRTDELPVESLPSPAASILALHEAPISWTRQNGAAVGQLMLAALLGIGAEEAGAAPTQPSAAATTFVSNVAAQRPRPSMRRVHSWIQTWRRAAPWPEGGEGREVQRHPSEGGSLQSELQSEAPTRWGYAEPSYDTQVAVLQQTIDDQSQQIKALEAAVEALRNLVCIMAGLVVVIL